MFDKTLYFVKSKQIYLFFYKLMHFFIKKGKKNRLENLFRLFLILRSKTKKQYLYTLLKKTISTFLPFLNLKIRKRGKYVKYKAFPISKEKGEKKVLLLFSKLVSQQKNKSFLKNLENNIENLKSSNNILKTTREENQKKSRRKFRPLRLALKKYYKYRKKKLLKLKKNGKFLDKKVLQLIYK